MQAESAQVFGVIRCKTGAVVAPDIACEGARDALRKVEARDVQTRTGSGVPNIDAPLNSEMRRPRVDVNGLAATGRRASASPSLRLSVWQ
eukprot:CAMPEP_0185202856 /NCGR_PEP_ID=MMETSP1140-20130426/51845_1 /TAXON_ID=298111 /ORGANISM="Pavlova sp., Strain CCMP459" /LENGTH=89 /DNA_ID=CAMNT_0027770329 /DNA_START=10 /DNA_END=277 /DNA_ORIENTATION=-